MGWERSKMLKCYASNLNGDVVKCQNATSPTAFCGVPFCVSDEPKSELARDLGDRIQSQNVPVGTSDD